MAELGFVFDPMAVKPEMGGGGDPIPAGNYKAMITKSDFGPNKQKTGQRLELVFEILEGDHKGSTVYAGLNLIHNSQKAENIAKGEMSTLCHSMGHTNGVTNSVELHNKPIGIKVVYVPPQGQYKAKNDIKMFMSLEKLAQAQQIDQDVAGADPQQQQNQQQQQQPDNGQNYQQAPQQQQAQQQATNGAAGASWRT